MPKHSHKGRTTDQRGGNDSTSQGFPNTDSGSRRHFSFRSTDRSDAFMFEGDTNDGPAIVHTGGRDSDGVGECEGHNNMPPYKPVLYLIKIKDER